MPRAARAWRVLRRAAAAAAGGAACGWAAPAAAYGPPPQPPQPPELAPGRSCARPPGERGNHLTIYHNPAEAFEAMWAAIAAARREVFFVTYILKDDEVGRQTLRLLSEAARRGVQVRLLYDDSGNVTGRRRLTRELREQPGAEVVCFRPTFQAWGTYIFSGFDYAESPTIRNHRKILLVDGETAFAGGLNVGNEYAGRECTTPGLLRGTFRDSMARLEGPACAGLREQLDEVFAGGCLAQDRARRLSWAEWDAAARRAPPAPPAGAPRAAAELPPGAAGATEPAETLPDCAGIEVLGCNIWLRDYSIQRALAWALRGARERVWLTTPYFAPPQRLLEDVEGASRRGVDVRVLVGGRGSIDPPIMWWIEQNWYRRLLAAGARLFEYHAPGSVMHAKLWTVDGSYASVGSFNLDLLSDFILETNLAARDQRAAANVERQFLRDVGRAQEITLQDLEERQHDLLHWGLITVTLQIYHAARYVLGGSFDEAWHF
eukprot:TRINITY_DN5142_c1_g1_i1.p1 TRINITY_DN5142_c1_g1~~TRINITY_DN5142_c1_g1_i1.p1  ORF type:complete len:491 (+),score=152.25 TRINITY_DN5142_c1_g1_i1:74-1546(+)